MMRPANRALQQTLVSLAALLVPVDALAERLPLKVYTTADGLSRDSVSCIVQDATGYVWFCTAEGLSRFDGYDFINYGVEDGLPHKSVNALVQTRRGEYWVATNGGLSRFDPSVPSRRAGDGGERAPSPGARRASSSNRPAFVTYVPSEDPNSHFVNTLVEDHAGNLWCGTRNGLYRGQMIAGRPVFERMPVEARQGVVNATYINAMIEDREGILWFGHGEDLIRGQPAANFERVLTRDGKPMGAVASLLEDRQGRIWVASARGLFAVDQAQGAVPDLLSETRVEGAVLQSRSGDIWLGNWKGEVEVLPLEGRAARLSSSSTPILNLKTNEVNVLAEDRDRNIWIGTQRGGVVRLAEEAMTRFGPEDGEWMLSGGTLFEDQAGELCDASGPIGVTCFDGRRFRKVVLDSGLDPNVDFTWGWHQTGVQDRFGEWWVATGKGLLRFPKSPGIEGLARLHRRALYTSKDGIAADFIFRVFEDSRSDLWISSFSGNVGLLTRWDRKHASFHAYSRADGVPDAAATSFVEDRSGSLWIGFYRGLARYRDGHFRYFTQEDGVPAALIDDLMIDDAGRLWIASRGAGLARVDDVETERPGFSLITAEQGLSSNEVRCLAEDLYGRVYACTGRGVDVLDTRTGRLKHLTTNDGLPSSELTGAHRDRQGALWFSGYGGIARFVPRPEPPTTAPPVLVSGLRIDGVPFPISALGETSVVLPALRPVENNLEISFLGLQLGAGERPHYRYVLDGVGTTPGLLREGRSLSLPYLAPGSYRFRVWAVNSEGIESTTPASISFTILSTLWRRWWFVTLSILALASIVAALYRARVGHLLALERVRTRIATDLHDDIGSSLSRISILSEVARKKAEGDSPRSREQLAVIAGASRDLVDAMSDIVWAINPDRDRLSDLTQRMRRFADDLFSARDIEFRFDAPPSLREMRLGSELRREVFLILKEAVNNAARHSGCTRAGVELRVEAEWLHLKVADDGRGFDPSLAGGGNGLASMRARATRLGGRLDLTTELGRGTVLTLTVPLSSRAKRRA